MNEQKIAQVLSETAQGYPQPLSAAELEAITKAAYVGSKEREPQKDVYKLLAHIDYLQSRRNLPARNNVGSDNLSDEDRRAMDDSLREWVLEQAVLAGVGAVRDQALEEAAALFTEEATGTWALRVEQIADAIRALKSTPAAANNCDHSEHVRPADGVCIECGEVVQAPAAEVAEIPEPLRPEQYQHAMSLYSSFPHERDSGDHIIRHVAIAGYTNGFQAGLLCAPPTYLEEIAEALEDSTLTSYSQVATGIRDLKERLQPSSNPGPLAAVELSDEKLLEVIRDVEVNARHALHKDGTRGVRVTDLMIARAAIAASKEGAGS